MYVCIIALHGALRTFCKGSSFQRCGLPSDDHGDPRGPRSGQKQVRVYVCICFVYVCNYNSSINTYIYIHSRYIFMLAYIH